MLSRLIKRLLKRLKDLLFVDETPAVKEIDMENVKPFDRSNHDKMIAKIWERVDARKEEQALPTSEPVLDEIKRMSSAKHRAKPEVKRVTPVKPVSPLKTVQKREIEETVYTPNQPIRRDDGLSDVIVGAAIVSSLYFEEKPIVYSAPEPAYQPEPVYSEPSYQPDPEPVASSLS